MDTRLNFESNWSAPKIYSSTRRENEGIRVELSTDRYGSWWPADTLSFEEAITVLQYCIVYLVCSTTVLLLVLGAIVTGEF